jgi:phosphate/sulfate permease
MAGMVGAIMETFLLNTLLGFLIAIIVGMFFRLELCHKSLIYALRESKTELLAGLNQNEFEIGEDLVENFKEDIKETVLEMIGQMRTPTAIDHLAGVAANIFQMREQWKIQKEQSEMSSLITAATDTFAHGAPKE